MSIDLIRAIVDEDFVTAKKITSDLLYQSAGDEVERVKMEVGTDILHDEISEEMVKESSATKDYDKDGEVESSKDEVLGSRINAAVKAGKLTPAQAANTKNKGKYR